MATKTDNLDTAMLILEILRLIPKTSYISTRELQEKLTSLGFERDIRTIQRILNRLTDKFGIECDTRDRPYGYRWKEQGKVFALPILNEQQSLLLKLAEQQLKNLLPADMLQSMRPFFEQAERVLTYNQSAVEASEWLNKICVVPTRQPLLPAKIDPDIFAQVSRALFHNYYLNIEYRNQEGRNIKAKVMPLALAQQGENLFLVVRFNGYDNERHLALHRFISATVSTFKFQRPSDFDLNKHQQNARFGFGNGEKICLRFSISYKVGYHLTETPLSKDQQILIGDKEQGYWRFQATVVDSPMLDWWLREFGDDIWDIEKVKLEPEISI